MSRLAVVCCSVLALVACATSPLGRQQLKLFPENQMAEMGVASYREVKRETPQVRSTKVNQYVDCVAKAVIAAIPPRYQQNWNWEVTVFAERDPNAFALPGGKVGVHEGLLEVAVNQDQLAAVIGHEIAHVLAGHANERISAQYVTKTGLDILKAASSGPTGERSQLFGLLGLGAQVGILLPYSRKHESEADLLGLDLMAEAGFDPRETVDFWARMQKAGGAKPPEFLSTHPAGSTRIHDLEGRMAHALPLFEQARAAGRRPACPRP